MVEHVHQIELESELLMVTGEYDQGYAPCLYPVDSAHDGKDAEFQITEIIWLKKISEHNRIDIVVTELIEAIPDLYLQIENDCLTKSNQL